MALRCSVEDAGRPTLSGGSASELHGRLRKAGLRKSSYQGLSTNVTSLTGDAEVSLQAFVLSFVTRTSALFSDLHRGHHSVDTGLPQAPRTSHGAGDSGCHPVWAVVLWAVDLPPINFGDHERQRQRQTHTQGDREMERGIRVLDTEKEPG